MALFHGRLIPFGAPLSSKTAATRGIAAAKSSMARCARESSWATTSIRGEGVYTAAQSHCDIYVQRLREVHCGTPWSFPARCIVLRSERHTTDADSTIDGDMIRRIPADVDFTANGAADTGVCRDIRFSFFA